jgi:ribonuclease HII
MTAADCAAQAAYAFGHAAEAAARTYVEYAAMCAVEAAEIVAKAARDSAIAAVNTTERK